MFRPRWLNVRASWTFGFRSGQQAALRGRLSTLARNNGISSPHLSRSKCKGTLTFCNVNGSFLMTNRSCRKRYVTTYTPLSFRARKFSLGPLPKSKIEGPPRICGRRLVGGLVLGTTPFVVANNPSEDNALLGYYRCLSEKEKTIYGLIGANILVFLFLRTSLGAQLFRSHFLLSTKGLVNHKNYHTLITMAFAHTELWHLGANMLCLYSLGSSIFDVTGRERFLAIYFSGALLSSLISVLFWRLRNPKVQASIGASGAICAIVMMFGCTYPEAKLSLMFLPFVGFTAWKLVCSLATFDLLGALFGWRVFNHVGHLAGLTLGYGAWSLEQQGKAQASRWNVEADHSGSTLRSPGHSNRALAPLEYSGSTCYGRPHGIGTVTAKQSALHKSKEKTLMLTIHGYWVHGWLNGPAKVIFTSSVPFKEGEVVQLEGTFERSKLRKGKAYFASSHMIMSSAVKVNDKQSNAEKHPTLDGKLPQVFTQPLKVKQS